MTANSLKASEHVAQVAAEHSAIRVQFVDDDVPEVFEQLRPPGMVRQDARVQHVGIAQHEMRATANRASRVLRRITVISERSNLLSRIGRDRFAESLKLGELILRERFSGKQVQRAAGAIAQHRVENRRVVAKRLS